MQFEQYCVQNRTYFRKLMLADLVNFCELAKFQRWELETHDLDDDIYQSSSMLTVSGLFC